VTYVRNGYYERYYNEIEKLGEGSFGQVFKLCDNYTQIALWAIKKITLRPEFKYEILREILTFRVAYTLQEKYAVRPGFTKGEGVGRV
jgi:hypothetical protein